MIIILQVLAMEVSIKTEYTARILIQGVQKYFHLLLVIVAVSEIFFLGHPLDVPPLNVMGHTL